MTLLVWGGAKVITKPVVGCMPKGATATQRSKKGAEKVLRRVLGRVLRRGSEKGPAMRRCLECPLGEYDPLRRAR